MSETGSLFTPVTAAYGRYNNLPILSARADDLQLLPVDMSSANAVQSVPVPEGAQAVEVDLVNNGAATVTVYILATDEPATDLAAQARTGIRRLVPPGAQLVEPRGVMGGDTLLLVANGALDARLTALVAGGGA